MPADCENWFLFPSVSLLSKWIRWMLIRTGKLMLVKKYIIFHMT